MPEFAEKITEACIDPRWAIHGILIDDAKHICFRVSHPRFGELAFILPSDSATKLSQGLKDAINQD